jgi:hypothetical protein
VGTEKLGFDVFMANKLYGLALRITLVDVFVCAEAYNAP